MRSVSSLRVAIIVAFVASHAGCGGGRSGDHVDAGLAGADAFVPHDTGVATPDASIRADSGADAASSLPDAFVAQEAGSDAGHDAASPVDAGPLAIDDQVLVYENGGPGFGTLVATVPVSRGRYDGRMTGDGWVYPSTAHGTTLIFTATPGDYVSPCTSNPHNVTQPTDGVAYTITWAACVAR